MTLSRRKTLALLGGGAIVAAAAASPSRSPARSNALAPWERPGQYDDPRMRALSWAILAPNPHNRQPWKVDLSVPGQAMLYVDTDRLLPHTDPFNRQIVIGWDVSWRFCAWRRCRTGSPSRFDLFPEGEDATGLDERPVAICRFGPPTAAPDPLFAMPPPLPEQGALRHDRARSRPRCWTRCLRRRSMAPRSAAPWPGRHRGDARPEPVRAGDRDRHAAHLQGKRRGLPHRPPRGRGQSRRDRVPRARLRGDGAHGLFTREAAMPTRPHRL
jgi:hypothetical protein